MDVLGAKKLSFWARGKSGGEKVTVGIGIIKENETYHDTLNKQMDLTLTDQWQSFSIDLTGKNLTRVKTPLFFTTSASGAPAQAPSPPHPP